MTAREVLKHFLKEIKATPNGKQIIGDIIRNGPVKRRKRPDGELEVYLPDQENRRH